MPMHPRFERKRKRNAFIHKPSLAVTPASISNAADPTWPARNAKPHVNFVSGLASVKALDRHGRERRHERLKEITAKRREHIFVIALNHCLNNYAHQVAYFLRAFL